MTEEEVLEKLFDVWLKGDSNVFMYCTTIGAYRAQYSICQQMDTLTDEPICKLNVPHIYVPNSWPRTIVKKLSITEAANIIKEYWQWKA